MAKRQMEEKNDTGLLTLMKDLLTVSFDPYVASLYNLLNI